MTLRVHRMLAALAAAVLSLATIAFALAPAHAADVSTPTQVSCGFSAPPTFNAGNAYSSTIVLSAPDNVAPGETFAVTVDANPMQNGPVAVNNPDEAVISAHVTVSGDAASPGAKVSSTWSNPAPLAANEQYDISPRPVNVTAGPSEGSITVTFDVIELYAVTINTSLWCGAFVGGAASNPSITIPIVASTTTTEGDTTTTSEGDTTTTTAGETTTTSEDTTTSTEGSTTSSTVADTSTTSSSTTSSSTTTTTIPKADIVSASSSVSYSCEPIVSGSALGAETATQTITMSAPDRVNPGDEFGVTMKMSPGPESGPIPLAAGTQQFRAQIKVSGGGSPSTVNVSGGSNKGDIAPNSIISIPSMRGSVTATGSAGDTISFAPGTFTIDSPSLDAKTICEPSGAGAVISTNIVSEPVSLSDDGSLPSTGLGDYTIHMAVAGLFLYVGLLFISTLPKRKIPVHWEIES